MGRKFIEPELVLATHNAGKLAEMQALLAPKQITVLGAADIDLDEPEETGETYEANALLKARAAVAAAGKPALADDSGLAVTALKGAPGIYSARWAGEPRDFGKAMEKVEAALVGHSDRRAAFVSVLALCWPDGGEVVVRGEVTGQLVWPPRGNNGFGYDPMFVPEGHQQTFGEMAPEQKHPISHRSVAMTKLFDACF